MNDYDSPHGEGASCSDAEICKDDFMTAVKDSYNDFFYNNFYNQEDRSRQIEKKIELHQRYHSIVEVVRKYTSEEVYQGCLKALREWIRDGPLTGVAEYEKKTLPKRNLDDVPEHERWSCCDGPPLERAISDIVEEVRAHESDDDLMKMYNEAKKARNHTYTTRTTLNDLVKSLERFLTRSFKTIQAAACRIFQ